ncbi:hypothetical protein D8674_024832 [Pyrus ussuriensis x Pyrus communis]|uniref:Myb-like domain-containing protein n=1 Tax=Pyrus ussuriensis x Pyrus communis TaxID=2448454 RepID=A0A5N5HB30_9ROSA|nr:hypothetical protein D8674_024832 [Pyrus ussuriensis x Pyrus communis]
MKIFARLIDGSQKIVSSSQTSEGVWTRMFKKYYEFYEVTTPPNPRNHESCSSRWKKHLQPSLNKWHQAVLNTQSRHESGANYYNEGWVLFQDPPQERFDPTLVFGNVSSNAVGNEQGSPIIQEIRVENPSLDESSIPRPMGQNKAQKLKENGKAKNDLAFREEMTSSLQLMVEQNVLATEERNHRHEERAKQIQEEMDDRNIQRNTSEYTPMSKACFDRKKREILARRELFISYYTPTMVDAITIIVFKMKLL